MFQKKSLTPMQSGRLKVALDRPYRFDGVVKTLRAHIEELAASGPLDLTEGDGMIDYSRTHFNRLGSFKEQDAYIAPQGKTILLCQRLGGSETGVRRNQALTPAGLSLASDSGDGPFVIASAW